MELHQITNDNDIISIENFLLNAGNSLKTFRYFEKRSLEVLKNHLVTYLLFEKNEPLAYGHLDSEDGIVWLGIAVSESRKGFGYGKKMMSSLIEFATINDIPEVRLSVDNDNLVAIKLYKKYGFKLINREGNISFFEWRQSSIYVSSLAFTNNSVEEMIELSKENNFSLEFSSGIPYRADMEEIYLSTTVRKMLHNYFPAPRDPFVINLASSNSNIRNVSIAHCLRGLQLAKKSRVNYFSAHAGFCIDPSPKQLGNPLNVDVEYDREKHWNLFIDSIKQLVEVANELDINFLIENNVAASFNIKQGRNPLFCCTPEEIFKMINIISNDSFGLLLDTAHLKVSSLTLGFDKDKAVQSLEPFVKYIHHSDNNGKIDTNDIVTENYWFLNHMSSFTGIPHVLEVRALRTNEIIQQVELLKKYLKNEYNK